MRSPPPPSRWRSTAVRQSDERREEQSTIARVKDVPCELRVLAPFCAGFRFESSRRDMKAQAFCGK
jgi:hypothetical protein